MTTLPTAGWAPKSVPHHARCVPKRRVAVVGMHGVAAAAAVVDALEDGGFAAHLAGEPWALLSANPRAHAELLIVGSDLPATDQLGLLRSLRARDVDTAIIVLGRPDGVDPTTLLESGADDHMTEPVQVAELVARVRARLRTAQPTLATVTAGALTLDLLARRCTIGDRNVELTVSEFALTEAFVRHPTQTLSRSQLARLTGRAELSVSSNAIDVRVSSLRRKLGPATIVTERGVGYRLAT